MSLLHLSKLSDLSGMVHNGLTKEWFGRVWCNPPYGSEASDFLKKFSEYGGKGLCLIFARTDTKAWHNYIFSNAKYIFFIKGRVKFCRENGEQATSANTSVLQQTQ